MEILTQFPDIYQNKLYTQPTYDKHYSQYQNTVHYKDILQNKWY
jgi:hypothetical protein